MKASEWARASRPLAEALTGFEPMRRGFVRRHEWVAECIYADSSSYSRTAFYLQSFALPLFVPTDHLYFNYGGRIGTRWEQVNSDLVHAVTRALPRLHELATLDGLVRSAQRPEIDLHHAEVHLCASLIGGDRLRFDQLARDISEWNEQLPWERPIIDRCVELSDAVHASGDATGLGILRERVPAVLSLLA